MRWLVCALMMAAGCGSPSKSQTPAPQRRSTNVIDAPKPSKRPRPAAVPAKTKVMELSVRGLYVSGALAKKDVNRALDTALAQLGDCDGRLSDWRSVVRGSVSMRVAATGAVERVSLPTAIDGLLGECVRNVLEPMLFPKQTRRTRVSFELEVMPTSLDDHEIAMLDKCDDLYRVCIERIYSRTVPKDDVLAALLEVHFGGPCNRAERRERYSVSLRFNQDGTFRDLKVRIRSGRKETQACLSNELARAQVSGPVSRSYASASFTLVLEPASTAPFDAAPAHVRLGLVKRQGSYSRSLVRSALRKQMPELRRCYDQAVSAKPGLAGTAMVRFAIAKGGASEKVEVRGVGEALGTCLATQIDAIKFRAPPSDELVTVEVPLTLVPARRIRHRHR